MSRAMTAEWTYHIAPREVKKSRRDRGSAGSRHRDTVALVGPDGPGVKAALYVRDGVRHYWIVYPDARVLQVHEAEAGYIGSWGDFDVGRVWV